MRVLVVTTDLDRPEAHLFAGLKRAGLDIKVICRAAAEFQDVLVQAGIPVTRHNIRRRIDRGTVDQLRVEMQRFRCSLVHALRKRSLSNVLWATRGTATRIVAYRGFPGYLSFLDPGSWLSFLHPRVGRIICVSEAVRDYFLGLRLVSLRVPPEKLVTIYKGHDPQWYTSADRAALEAFGVPREAMVIGCVANMVPRKGVDVLIEAMARVPAPLAPHLLLVGSVRDRRVHAAFRASPCRDRIHFAGYRRDAAALAGALDLFVLPTSGVEGLPRAVLEAMAQGVPAIVTDVPGSREVVQDQLNGRIVPPGDPQALAKAIATALSDPDRLARYRESARARVTADFNIDDTIRRTLDLYQDLLTARPS